MTDLREDTILARQTIDCSTIADMFLAGAGNLNSKKDWINELNVFPVPDGDTGTNMTMTILAAAKEVNSLSDKSDLKMLCKAISSGSLRGARGNSGVILSQLLRGFTKILQDEEKNTVDARCIARGFNKAVETAYKAVMKPKEGTILTVARAMAERASETCDRAEDLESFFSGIIEYGDHVLGKTTDMLPELKKAGVVDSGGQGLMQVIKGAYEFYCGRLSLEELSLELSSGAGAAVMPAESEEENIKFGYCTEFIIMLDKPKAFNSKAEADLKGFLESIGDSIVCVAADDIVKIHVHTNDPGLAIQRALKLGQLSNMKIDNMRLEHHERVLKSEELKKAGVKNIAGDNVSEEAQEKKEPEKYGFVSVLAGDGLAEIFRGLGVDGILEGGQTMNPSTEDMLKAIDSVNAENVFILPNNKNIILAANQAKELVKDKNVVIIPTKTVPQGISAVINFMPDMTPEENEAAMNEAITLVKTGQLTYAVRDTVIEDFNIKSGDIMGIGDKSILSAGSQINDTALDMLDKLVDEDSCLVSLYYGEEQSQEEAAELMELVSERFPQVDVELHEGGQPIYYYIISVE